MKRFHSEIALMKRRLREASRHHFLVGEPGNNEERTSSLSRWRKRHPLDCGSPRCGLCHPHKRWSYGPRRSEQARAAIDEQLIFQPFSLPVVGGYPIGSAKFEAMRETGE